ncbi:sps18p [Saccharomyces arboricola H-6]|uniref:Sps18p n=1 Tax=Saccharomyces arboricola (strain H-6 / AS 2.3317 / CBS 10644) TaxID=1160507 RepID=J8Q342_SACAR|nr:sps18p [Saccharomyces arboricola H-6]
MHLFENSKDMENRKRLLSAKKSTGNNKCFECKSVNPQFISCSFGIFVCVNCANLLRGLDAKLFCVKSITMDSFEEKDIRRIEKSGNFRFGCFLSKNGILQNGISLREKYDNLFAKSYRRRLTNEVRGNDINQNMYLGFNNFEQYMDGAINQMRGRTLREISGNTLNSEGTEFILRGKASNPNNFHDCERFPNRLSVQKNLDENDVTSATSTLTIEKFQNDPIGTISKSWVLLSDALHKSYEEFKGSVVQPTIENIQQRNLTHDLRRSLVHFNEKLHETPNLPSPIFSCFTGEDILPSEFN